MTGYYSVRSLTSDIFTGMSVTDFTTVGHIAPFGEFGYGRVVVWEVDGICIHHLSHKKSNDKEYADVFMLGDL